MTRPLKLITAVGTNENLILELFDFFCGGQQYLYSEEGAAIRERFLESTLEGLYLVCTSDSRVQDTLEKVQATIGREYPALSACIHIITLDCNDIACDGDDENMRLMVYEKVRELAADNLIISSGGRKTVTNRLIEAGLLFGCMGYLTITAPDERDPLIRRRTKEYNVLWTSGRSFAEKRWEGFMEDRQGIGDTFRSLAFLPLAAIKRLKTERVGADPTRENDDLAWLRKLPKADLHCHLGGAFDPDLLKELATLLLNGLKVSCERRGRIKDKLVSRLGCPLAQLTPEYLSRLNAPSGKNQAHCLKNLKGIFAALDEPVHICNAILVNELSPEQIATISWSEPSHLADNDRLDWYMACGDLGGSALLQTEAGLSHALRWLMESARRQNTRFLEIRFSPGNYTAAGLSIHQVTDCLLSEATTFEQRYPGFQVRFLVMATRHKEQAAMDAHVTAAILYSGSVMKNGPRVTGFDLAGQEEGNEPARFQDIFKPLHRHFINITIHAGEMAEEDKIWQALYHLHAKRIGHGLKLIDNQKMMGYVRDHGIAIEMCPSSNRQTMGFRRFDREEQGETYPLKHYLDHGIIVTVNTDNPGISRTNLSREYLEAARLTPDGLSKWDILRLVRNGFRAIFLPKDEKDALLKEIDREVYGLILDDFFGPAGERM